jgi:polysaccharide biosynthesis protein PslJ
VTSTVPAPRALRASNAPGSPERADANARRRRTRPARPGGDVGTAWPLVALFVWFPVWWFLGLGAFVWPLLAIPMLVVLVRRGRVEAPRGFGVWLLFVAWVVVSGAHISGAGAGFSFLYRLAMYLSVTVLFLYVYNLDRELPAETVGKVLASFWAVTVAGGFLGILAPGAGFRTLVERQMPPRLLNNPLVFRLVHPVFADVQQFLGYRVARPVAPFLYSNYWGSVFALTVPFVIWRIQAATSPAQRARWMALGLASLVPQVFSLNRGMWLSLGVGLVYAALRQQQRRLRALRNLVLAILVIAALIAATPLRQLVVDRAETGHSNDGRALLYEEAIKKTSESPWVGFGAPQPVDGDKELPPVGTQGQFWLVMVSQGFVGLALFTGWFLIALRRTRHATSAIGRWCHVAVLIFVVQLPIYDMLPYQFHLVMVTAAFAMREVARAPAA